MPAVTSKKGIRMTTWTTDELRTMAAAEEVQVSSHPAGRQPPTLRDDLGRGL